MEVWDQRTTGWVPSQEWATNLFRAPLLVSGDLQCFVVDRWHCPSIIMASSIDSHSHSFSLYLSLSLFQRSCINYTRYIALGSPLKPHFNLIIHLKLDFQIRLHTNGSKNSKMDFSLFWWGIQSIPTLQSKLNFYSKYALPLPVETLKSIVISGLAAGLGQKRCEWLQHAQIPSRHIWSLWSLSLSQGCEQPARAAPAAQAGVTPPTRQRLRFAVEIPVLNLT